MVDVGATLVVAQTPMLQRMGRDAQNAKQMSGECAPRWPTPNDQQPPPIPTRHAILSL